MRHRTLLTLLALTNLLSAATAVRVIDASAAPFPNVLMIVKSLDSGTETARYLTDADGRVPMLQLGRGLYRIILTCPYGICETTIVELLGQATPATLQITAPIRPTDGSHFVVGEKEVSLDIVSAQSRPAVGLQVLVRSEDATRERWYVSDQKGRTKILLQGDPSIVVIVDGEKLHRFRLSKQCIQSSPQPPMMEECIVTDGQPIRLKLR